MSISIAILVSGRGSNMQSILQAMVSGKLEATVPIVLSNNPAAPALQIAREFGVPSKAISNKGLTREEHEEAMLEELRKHSVDYVVLAGYMRILTPHFLREFKDPNGYFRVINIHPSLLPAFPGASAYEDAFAYGCKLSGITIHLVDEQVDHGPILAQESFPRLDDDTLESFKARGLRVEHQMYPLVLQMLSQGHIRLPQKPQHDKMVSSMGAGQE